MTKYSLIPHYNKSLMETQTWNRTLKNGKLVTLKVFNTYRCFNIEIELDDEEKAEILNLDTILLDKYSMSIVYTPFLDIKTFNNDRILFNSVYLFISSVI